MCNHNSQFGTLVVFASVILLAACAHRVPVGVAPGVVAPAEAASSVEVAFLTNRQLETDGDGLDYYGGARGQVTAGRCRVAIRDAEDHDGRLLEVAPGPVDAVMAGLGGDGEGVVVYIHGFNEDFGRSCRHAALLQSRLGLDGRFLMFSWPADRRYVTYASDAGDLAWSLPDLQGVLEDLVARHGAGKVSVLGHSLGARAAVEVLGRMNERDGALEQVVLVAPDIARSRFSSLRPVLERQTGRVTIYASGNDLALRLSTVVNTSSRLGITDDEGMPSPDVEVVDVSQAGVHSLSGHLYHLRNPAVIADMARLFGSQDGTGGAPYYERVPGSAPGLWHLQPVSRETTAATGRERPKRSRNL